jgi:hypothetical protein
MPSVAKIGKKFRCRRGGGQSSSCGQHHVLRNNILSASNIVKRWARITCGHMIVQIRIGFLKGK